MSDRPLSEELRGWWMASMDVLDPGVIGIISEHLELMYRRAAALEAENARLREMIGQARYPDCPTTHGIAKMLNAARRGVET
jgi:hypothetical protein